MSGFRSWSQPARFLTLTMIMLSLTIGLCSMGPGFDQAGTLAQGISAWLGVITFLCFIACLLTTIGVSIEALLARWKR